MALRLPQSLDPTLRVRSSDWGTRNATGEPGAYSAPDLTPSDPHFLEAIERGVRPLVLEIVERGFVTYTSCEGHRYPDEVGLPPVGRSVGVLPRGPAELDVVRRWFDRTIQRLSPDEHVRVERHDLVLSDASGRTVPVCDLALVPIDSWEAFFDAVDAVTAQLLRLLRDAWLV